SCQALFTSSLKVGPAAEGASERQTPSGACEARPPATAKCWTACQTPPATCTRRHSSLLPSQQPPGRGCLGASSPPINHNETARGPRASSPRRLFHQLRERIPDLPADFQGGLGHLLSRLQDGHVGFIGASGGDHVHHLGHYVHIGQENVSVLIGV